jgi:mRNA-degrading endonuclease RelE of RelBE toxin-antitoxin system
MVTVACSTRFEKTIRKIQVASVKERVKAQIRKIINNPQTGKPMRYCRKNTRGVNIPPFQLSYYFDKNHDKIVFLAPCHKDEQ